MRLGLAWRLPRNREDADNWALSQREYDTARRPRIPIQVHVSGEAQPMLDALIERGYLYPGLTLVHATDATPEQLQALEQAGGSLALTPVSEHRVGYGLTRLDHFSAVTRQGLGIDGNALAGSADMFASLRLVALTWSGGLRGAEALGLSDEIGSITPGKPADLQIIALNDVNLAGFGGAIRRRYWCTRRGRITYAR